jgi:hypothetical protein
MEIKESEQGGLFGIVHGCTRFYCVLVPTLDSKDQLMDMSLLQNASLAIGVSDFSNKHLVTCVYSGSSVMSPNRPSLQWPSVATILGDIISSPIAIVTIW